MEQELLDILQARSGHFLLESGYHGEYWLDLDSLFVVPGRIQPFVALLAKRLGQQGVQAVCGPMTGGAFLAQSVALLMGVEFFYTERIVPVERDTMYPVEYRLPDAARPMVRGKSFAIVDDAISAGSAVRATYAELLAHGANPLVMGALLVLGSQAALFCREEELALEYVTSLPYRLWLPSDCPMCASGVPIEDMGGA